MAGKIIRREGAGRKQVTKLVTPTIMIGLGGTGKEVLLRVRQRFYEKYGSIGFPVMRYLWIDTDLQNHNIDGKPLDYIAAKAFLNEDEKIGIEVPASEFMSLFSRPKANQHIFRWMDPALKALGSVTNGARQIRLLGRLGFFQHAYMNNDIRGQLGKAKDEVLSVRARNQMLDEYHIQVEEGIQVIIVCSLAGGTGSGTFLDMAFMVRDEFKGLSPDLVGYLVMPSVFAPDVHHAEAIYSNAYAALKELEYYSMRKDMLMRELSKNGTDEKVVSAHDFIVEWKAGIAKTIQGPPFNTCYLIDNQTDEGGKIGPQHKTDLCDMIAENLFLNFSSQAFSAKKRSVRSNLDDYLTNELEYEYKDDLGRTIHSEIFSFRFSAFGLSKIFIPVDRIRKACAFKLGSELLAYAMKSNPIEGDPTQVIRNEALPDLQLRVGTGVDDFRDALWLENDQRQSFLAAIQNAWQLSAHADLKQKLSARQPNLSQEFTRKFEQYERTHLNLSREREKWGSFVKRLYNANKAKFLEESKTRILNLVRRWMDNPYIRAEAAIEYLEELNRVLKEHGDHFQKSSETAEQAARYTAVRLRSFREILVEEESGLWMHRWAMHELIELLCGVATDYFTHRVMSLVYMAAKECCDELRSFIGEQNLLSKPDEKEEMVRRGLIRIIWSVQEDMQAMQREFEAGLRSFEHTEQHLIFENLYEPGMFENYYRLPKGNRTAKIDETELKRLEDQVRERLKIKSIFDLNEKRQQIGFGNILDELINFCMEQFQELKLEVDAIHTLFERYQHDKARVDDMIKRFVQKGRVWVKSSALAKTDSAITQNYAEEIELGINQKGMQHRNYEDFGQKVRSILANSFKGQLHPSVDVEPDAVYLYNEYAGIPLMYLNRIDDYREAYRSHYVKHKRTPHIDRQEDKFQDILIKEQEEVQDLIKINQVLLVGAILRVIDVSVMDGEAVYRYQDHETFPPTPIPLGNQYLAMETLRRNLPLLNKIQDDIEKVRRRLEGDAQARLKFFTTLTYHNIGDDFMKFGIPAGPFPPKWVKVGNTIIQKFAPEHRALQSAIVFEKHGLLETLQANEARLNELFVKLYKEVDSFTDHLQVNGVTLRVLKKAVIETMI